MTYVQIQFTVDDREVADVIVETLLRRHLIACGQLVGPMVSRYWWQGSLERADEWLVLMKTRRDLSGEVTRSVVELHPYDTPEVLALPVVDGASGYLAWVGDVTGCEDPMA